MDFICILSIIFELHFSSQRLSELFDICILSMIPPLEFSPNMSNKGKFLQFSLHIYT